MHISEDSNLDRRVYNAPTASEVAVVMSEDTNTANRDIVLTTKRGPLQRINELNPAYDICYTQTHVIFCNLVCENKFRTLVIILK